MPQPNSWPVDGNYVPTRTWLNEGGTRDDGSPFLGVMGFRRMENEARVRNGKQPVPLEDDARWSEMQYPKIDIAASYQDYLTRGSLIYALGITLGGQHDYRGAAIECAFERNKLTTFALPYGFRFVWEVTGVGTEPETPPDFDLFKSSNAPWLTEYARILGGTVNIPPDSGEPTPIPTPTETPTPPPALPGSGGLPPGAGFYGTWGPQPTPGTPTPAPAVSDNLVMGDFDVTGAFTGRVVGPFEARQYGETLGHLFFFADAKPEVVIARADVPNPGFFMAFLTDVGCEVTVANRVTGESKTHTRAEGTQPDVIWF